jgi:hypothetical protein
MAAQRKTPEMQGVSAFPGATGRRPVLKEELTP